MFKYLMLLLDMTCCDMYLWCDHNECLEDMWDQDKVDINLMSLLTDYYRTLFVRSPLLSP